MHSDIHVGSTFVLDPSLLEQVFGVPSRPYAKSWSLLTADSEGKGWHLLFIATQIKAIALGGAGSAQLDAAIRRMLKKASREDFNCLEVTQLKPKHFWGVPYLSIVAHSRHLQSSNTLGTSAERKISRGQARRAGSK
jgi:hypothetical protein